MKKQKQQLAFFEGGEKAKTAEIIRGAALTPEAVRLLANFETLTEAPGGIKRLRQLILGLAMQGKLVPQEARDEPAEVLADRIAAENGTKNSCGITQEDEPFKLPSTWMWVRGERIFTFTTSGSRGWAEYYSAEGPIFLRIGNLDYGTTNIDLTSIQRVSPPSNAEGTRTRTQPGDILVSITGDTGMVGLVPEDLGEAYINQHIAMARPSRHVYARFIASQLTAPFSLGRLQREQRGIKNSLGLDSIRSLLVALPPRAEQQRIVAKVDELMALCDEMEARQAKRRVAAGRLNKAALGELTSAEGPEELAVSLWRVVGNFESLADKPESVGELRKAILELAMRGRVVSRSPHDEDAVAHGGPHSAPKEEPAKPTVEGDYENRIPYDVPEWWSWVRLSTVLRRMQYGTSEKAHEHAVGIPVLRMGNLKDGHVVTESLKYVRDNIDDIDGLLLDPGDILFNRTNSYELVGKSAVFLSPPTGFNRCTFASYLIRVTLNEKLALSTFVNLYFATPTFRATQIAPGATQQTGQANFSGGKLKLVWVPLPPLAEQARIVAKVDHLMALCDTLEAKLRAADEGARRLAESLVAELLA